MSYQKWEFKLAPILDPILKPVGLRFPSEVSLRIECIVGESKNLKGIVMWTVGSDYVTPLEELTEKVEDYARHLETGSFICLSCGALTKPRYINYSGSKSFQLCLCGKDFTVPLLYGVLWEIIKHCQEKDASNNRD